MMAAQHIRILVTLDSGTGMILGSMYHNVTVLYARCTRLLGRVAPESKNLGSQAARPIRLQCLSYF